MALPKVSGWIIDFRTARQIFDSGSNLRINHCVELCGNGDLFACHCEENAFNGHAGLKAAFIDGVDCIAIPNEDVMERCIAISNTPFKKKRLIGAEAPLFITAYAASNKFGVISDYRSPAFMTVYDLCLHYGVPVLSADDYFAQI